jgi:hypothetical protein
MNKKIYNFFFFLFFSIPLQSCDWCKSTFGRGSSDIDFFMDQYLLYIKPSTSELLALYQSLCPQGFVLALKKQIDLLGRHPDQYFHVSDRASGGSQLLSAVKIFDRLINFVHGFVVDGKTKKIMPYSYKDRKLERPFLAQYIQRHSKKDQYGCTVIDDLHAYTLSYAGALFNSLLLKNTGLALTQKEMRPLMFLFNTIEFLVGQLRNTPYQVHAEKSLQQWTRLYKTIEKEWKDVHVQKKLQHA